MKDSYNKKLRQEARKTYENALASIDEKISIRDRLNAIGKKWVSEGKFGRSYDLDYTTPFYLLLKMDRATTIEFDVNFMIEHIAEQFPEFIENDTEIDETYNGIGRISLSFHKDYERKFYVYFMIPKKGTCQIITERIEEPTVNIKTKSKIICS